MARQVSFAVRVLDKDETALCDGPDLSLTSFVFQRTIKPDGQHTFGHCVPIDLSHTRWNLRETNPQSRIAGETSNGVASG